MSEDLSDIILVQKFLRDELEEREAAALLRLLRQRKIDAPENRRLCDHLWMNLLLEQIADSEQKLLDGLEPLFPDLPVQSTFPTASPEPEVLRLESVGFDGQLRQILLHPDLISRIRPGNREGADTEDPSEFLPVLLLTAPHPAGSRTKTSKSPKSFASAWVSMGIMLVVFVSGVYWEFFRQKPTSEDFKPIAQIVESVEAEWEEGSEAFKVGRELETTALKLRSGVVELEFGDGARVVLEGPTEFLVKGRDTAFCQHGRISVTVPPRGIGFEVSSPTAQVVDLGTAFSMQVEDGKSDVHVLSGKVEVKRSAKEKFLLLEGASALLDLLGETKRTVADPKTFFSEKRLVRQKTDYIERKRGVWEAERAKLQADPSLLFRLDPDAATGLSRVDGNTGPKAVRFQNVRDRLRISPNRTAESLTILAMVRLDEMTNFANTILVGDYFGESPGEFLWQLNRFGALQFHLDYGEKTARQFDSPSVVRRVDCKTWVQLALVVDAPRETITHYFEGKPVSALSWKEPRPIRLDRMTLGNESPKGRKSSARFFGGAIEQCWIHARPFTDREVEQFYRNNRY